MRPLIQPEVAIESSSNLQTLEALSLIRAVSENLNSHPHLRWKHSAEYGWVVLDKNDVRNGGSHVYIWKCDDWSEVKILPRTFDDSSLFLVYRKHIENLDLEKLPRVCEQVLIFFKKFTEKNFYQKTYTIKREKELILLREKAKIAHEKLLKEENILYKGAKNSSTTKEHRITHCFRCKNDLETDIDMECIACGWLICVCGACGCTYH